MSKANREPSYGFLFNQERCTGCKTCEMACKDYHGQHGAVAQRTVYEFCGGTWTQDATGAWRQEVFSYHLSVSCGHCGNPVCLRVCPADAVQRGKYGFLRIAADKCTGCQTCAVACPYHAPRFDAALGVTVKCDGCADRIALGLKPICVEACPQRALDCLPLDDLMGKGDPAASLAPLPDPVYTQPNLVIRSCATTKRLRSEDGAIENIREA